MRINEPNTIWLAPTLYTKIPTDTAAKLLTSRNPSVFVRIANKYFFMSSPSDWVSGTMYDRAEKISKIGPCNSKYPNEMKKFKNIALLLQVFRLSEWARNNLREKIKYA